MKHDVTILALSRKWGGRCVAGYDHSERRVIRLVSDRFGGKLETQFTSGINPLDVVGVEIVAPCPIEHQTENVQIDLNCPFTISGASNMIQNFDGLVYRGGNVFGDNWYKLNSVLHLDHSFELIKFNNMSIYVEDGKTKADFYVERTSHRWCRVTDMVHEGESAQIRSGYAVVTLPPSDEFTAENGYFKYIAAIYPTDV